jgi:multimeric flavodoxin WrbA
MNAIGLIAEPERSDRLQLMIEEAEKSVELINYKKFESLENRKLIIAVDIDEIGESPGIFNEIRKWYQLGKPILNGSVVVLWIHSQSRLYTKEMAQRIIFLLSGLGATIPAQPLIETVENLENMRKWAEYMHVSREEALKERVSEMTKRLSVYQSIAIKRPKLLVLHANSNERTSNTHLLWQAVEKHLTIDYEVIHVEDGTVLDCRGCAYDTCGYYAEHNSCFYGGVMVKEILPAIDMSDAVLWLLPNYNDAISAKLMAVINRLTVLYRKKPILNKNLYAIVVSGNSGSDSVIKQLIGALNINKGFHLPSGFYLEMIASYPREILNHKDLNSKSKAFAEIINKTSHKI